VNRRNFIEKSGVLAATTLLTMPSCTNKKAPKYKLGYQLFSVNEDMTKAPLATLKALKAMGYEDFETFGFDPEKGTYYDYSASEFKTILEDLELTATSGHYGFAPFLDKSQDDLKRFVDQCIKGAHALNKPYITWPWMAPEQRNIETFKRMPEILNKIGEQINGAGLGFAYHNHGFEFDDYNGTNGYDIIVNETDPSLVKLQIDMYWVMHSSKFTPAELIKDQPKRYVMWHIKDMDKVSRDYTELGNGSIDYLKLLPDPDESGLEFYFIEQGGNYAHNSTKSAEDSANYFKKNLQQFL